MYHLTWRGSTPPPGPDGVIEFFWGDHMPRPLRQEQQEVVFQRAQGDLIPSEEDPGQSPVDDQVPSPKAQEPRGRGLQSGTAEHGLNPGEQFGRVKGFDHVVVRPPVQPIYDGIHLTEGREEQNGDRRLPPDVLADLLPLIPGISTSRMIRSGAT
jgi:hypothetical protein